MIHKKRSFSFALLCAAMASALLAYSAPSAFALENNATTHSKKTLFGPLWRNGHGNSSTLILRNRDRQKSINAEVVLFSHDGHSERRTTIEVAADSVTRLPLSKIIGTERKDSEWGSLAVEFHQTARLAVMGQVIIENETKGVVYDLPLGAGNILDTDNALYAPWWLPDSESEATIVLFNSGRQEMSVTPSVNTGEDEHDCELIRLSSRETQQLSIRQLMRRCNISEAVTGAVTLRYTGLAHTLVPALLLSNNANGFHLAPAFNARQREQSAGHTVWRFPAVFTSADGALGLGNNESLTAYALVSNVTSSVLSPHIEAFLDGPDSATKQIVLPVSALKPMETRLIDFSRWINADSLQKSKNHFSLRVSYDSSAGALALAVFSVGKAGDFVFTSQGSLGASTAVDSSYWDISDDLTALVTVENESNRRVEVRPTLHFDTTNGPAYYILPNINLSENASEVVNLKTIVLSGIPDENGATIPAGTTFGTITLGVVGGRSSDRIAGGTTSADSTRGAYGGLMIPLCNDPGPWNGFAIFYLDGIELPPCFAFVPAVDICALFGDCGGGGDPDPPFSRVLTLSFLMSSCSPGAQSVTLSCVWSDSFCSARQPVVLPSPSRCGSSSRTQALQFTSAHAGYSVSCAPTVTTDNRCLTITTPEDERFIVIPFVDTSAPPSDPPPPDPPPSPDPPPPPIPD